MEIRFAKREELEEVNVLRKQVNDIHAAGRPDIFRAGFTDELRDYVYEIFEDENKDIVIAIENGEICCMAVINEIHKPSNPFMLERSFLDVDEFCVKDTFRRKGIAGQMIVYIKSIAKERGLQKLELNMWEFNEEALAFYEAAGFHTYRRYMEMEL